MSIVSSSTPGIPVRKVLSLICSGCVGILFSKNVYAQQPDSTQHRLDEVVVTAQYQPQSLRKSVYKMQVIDLKKIEARAATNVQQILSGELGIRFANDMALGTADISLMGMSGRNIKILLDGVPLLDRGDTRESLNQINAAQVERIEIIEGPMSIIYGSDAQAGIINIITKKPQEERIQAQAQVLEETAGGEYNPGTHKGLHTQQLSAAWDNGRWNTMIGMLHYDFGGYGADSIGRNHSWKPKAQWLPSVRFGYRAKRWDVLYRNDYLLEQIIGKGAINTDIYKATTQTYTTSRMAQQAQLNYRWSPKLSLNSSLGFTDYKRYTQTELIDYNTRTISLSAEPGAQDTVKFTALNFRASVVYNYNSKLSLQPGIEYSRDAADGARIQKGSPVIHNYAAYLSVEYKPTDYINIRPGIRISKNSTYEAPPFLPSVNTLFRLNDKIALRLSYAQGYRAPALRELYFVFRDANHDVIGNPDLKPEYSHSLNGSVAYRKPVNDKSVYATELGYFYNAYTNLISFVPNVNNPQQYHYLNIAHYKTTGLSLSNKYTTEYIEWKIGGLLLGQYNAPSEMPEFKKQLSTFSWSPEVNVEIMYHLNATKTKINLFYKFTGRRDNYVATTDPVTKELVLTLGRRQAYHTADLNIQQHIHAMLSITAGVRNLFNVSTLQNSAVSGSVHGSGSNSMPFSYGRSYFMSLNVNFNNKLK